MGKQLQISFPTFPPDMFGKIKELYWLDERKKMEEEIEHLKNSIRTHKGHYTKIKKKK